MSLEELLRELHYLKSYKGFSCLVGCIQRVKEDEKRLCRIRREVYRPVAEKEGVRLENLEKNLRTVRDVFFRYGGREFLEEKLRVEMNWELYPRELIEALAECITDRER